MRFAGFWLMSMTACPTSGLWNACNQTAQASLICNAVQLPSSIAAAVSAYLNCCFRIRHSTAARWGSVEGLYTKAGQKVLSCRSESSCREQLTVSVPRLQYAPFDCFWTADITIS